MCQVIHLRLLPDPGVHHFICEESSIGNKVLFMPGGMMPQLQIQPSSCTA